MSSFNISSTSVVNRIDLIQDQLIELLAISLQIQDKDNTSVFISLEDFNAQKYYLYCSKEIWQKSLQLPLEGKRFINLSKNEFHTIKQRQIEL